MSSPAQPKLSSMSRSRPKDGNVIQTLLCLKAWTAPFRRDLCKSPHGEDSISFRSVRDLSKSIGPSKASPARRCAIV